LGPIAVGPSPSHTAAAVKFGLICRLILGGEVKRAKITFYGTFAKVFQAQGTDKAVIGGLLGFGVDSVKIRESLQLAEFRGLSFELIASGERVQDRNAVLIEAESNTKSVSIRGTSVVGAAAKIIEINGFEVEAAFSENTVIVFNSNTESALSAVAQTLYQGGHELAGLRFSRAEDGKGIIIIEVKDPVNARTIRALRRVQGVSDVAVVPKL